jgi:hypothetical protein
MMQRMAIATLAGESAAAVSALADAWRSKCDPDAVDRFCSTLRETARNCQSSIMVNGSIAG